MTAIVGKISPMGFGSPSVFVRRAYREGKPFQWLREAYVNSVEADATQVIFDVDLASFAELGLLRMQIEDDGHGINPDEIATFLNTFGGGGKPIGDEHDNFGVGFKSSALPWNPNGVVVRSLYNGEVSVSVLVFDTAKDIIGLEHLPTADQDDVDASTEYDTTLVFSLADIAAGETWIWRDIDWLKSFPEWIIKAGHGTVFTFLGSDAWPHTYLGDPNVTEERASRWASVWYADTRFWSMPAALSIGGCDVAIKDPVKAVPQITKALDKRLGFTPGAQVKHWQGRNAYGLETAIHKVPKKAGQPDHVDDTDMEDITTVTTKGWVKTAVFNIGADTLPATCSVYFKDTPLDHNDFGWAPARKGLVSALYKNELYDSEHGVRHRQFGIPYPDIYNMVWIVIEPVLAGTDESGVYPGTSRSHLHWKGAGSRANNLPWSEWADEFLQRMSVEVPFLYEAIKNYVSGAKTGDEMSKSLLKRVADKFASRFKPIPKPPKFVPSKRPTKNVGRLQKSDADPQDSGTNPGGSSGRRSKGKRQTNPSPGPNPGNNPGSGDGAASGDKSWVPGKGTDHLRRTAQTDDDLPRPVWVDFASTHPDMLAEAGKADLGVVYLKSLGVVECHIGHAVIQEVIEYWTKQYGTVHKASVTDAVKDVYGTAVSAAVGHIIRQKLDPDTLNHRLEDLTAKFYGLYDADDLVKNRIVSTLGRSVPRKRAS